MIGLEDENAGDTGVIFYCTILVIILYIRHLFPHRSLIQASSRPFICSAPFVKEVSAIYSLCAYVGAAQYCSEASSSGIPGFYKC